MDSFAASELATSAVNVSIASQPFDWIALASFALAVAAFAGTTFLTLNGWRKASLASAALQREQLRLEMERLVYLDTARSLDFLFTALAGAQAYVWEALRRFGNGQANAVESIDPARAALVRLVGEPEEALSGQEALSVFRTPLSDYALIRPEVTPVRDQLFAETTPFAHQTVEAIVVLDSAKIGEATGQQVAAALGPLFESLENWRCLVGSLDETLRVRYMAAIWERETQLPVPDDERTHVVTTATDWRIEGELTIS